MLIVFSALSILLQAAAFGLSLRVLKLAREKAAFILMAIVTGLMAVRRVVVFWDVIQTSHVPNLHLSEELLAITISSLFVAGFWILRNHMLAMNEASQRLSESEAGLRALIDQAGDGVLVRESDGTVLAVNSRFCELTGFESTQLIGRKVTALIGSGDSDHWVYQPGLRYGGGQDRVEQQIACRDGSRKVVEIQSRLRTDGRIDDFIRDITHLRETQQRLEATEAEHAHLLKVTAVLSVRVSPDFRWQRVDSQLLSLIDRTEAELIDKPTREFTPTEDALDEWRLTQQLVQGNKIWCEFEKRLMARSGAMIRFHVTRVAVRDQSGKILHYLDFMVNAASPRRNKSIADAAPEYWQSVLHSIPAPAWTCDWDGRFTYVNGAWLSFRGRTRSQEMERGWIDGIHSGDLAEFREVFATAVESRQSIEVEIRLLHHDGEYRWMRLSGAPYSGPDGVFAGYVGLATDVTEFKATRRRLQTSESLYRKALELSHLGGFEWNLNNLRYTGSPEAIALCGIDADTFDGRMETVLSHIHPDDRDIVLKANMDLLSSFDAGPIEFRVVLADGSIRLLRSESSLEYDVHGCPVRKYGILKDITTADGSVTLVGDHAQLAQFSQSIPVMLLSVDSKGRLERVSDLWLKTLGYERAEVLGRPLTDFLVPTSRAIVDRELRPRLDSEGFIHDLNLQAVMKDNQILDISISASARRGKDDIPAGALLLVTDVTEKKRAWESLAQSEERFRILSEASGDGVIISDNGVILDVNSQLCRMLGYQAAELTLESLSTIVRSDDLSMVLDRSRANDQEPFEFRGVHREGRELLMRAFSKLVPYHGRTARLIALRDVTQERLTQEELQVSRERFRMAAELASDTIYDIDLSRGGGWVSIPASYRDLFGVKGDYITIEDWLALVHPDDRERLQEMRSAVRRSGDVCVQEYRLMAPSGSVVWVRDTSLLGGECTEDPTRKLGVLTDITRQRELLEERRRGELALLAASRIAGVGYWEHRLGTGAVKCSEQLYRIFGVEPGQGLTQMEEILGRIYPEDRQLVATAIASVSELRPTEAEFRICLPNGEIRYCHSVAQNIRDAGTDTVRRIGACRDVTEARLSSEALKHSEAQYRLLVEYAPVGIFIHTGTILQYVNAAMMHMWGATSVSELVGRDLLELVPGDLQSTVAERIKKMFDSRDGGEKSPKVITCDFKRLDGSTFVAEITPVRMDLDGEASIQVFVRDVSQLRLTMDQLKASERRFKLALQDSSTTVFTTDLDLRYTWIFNSQEFPTGNVVGKTDEELFVPDDAERLKAIKKQVLESGKPLSPEFGVHVRGRQRYFAGNLEPLCNSSGEMIGVVGAITDVTELKQANIEASQRQGRLKLLVGIATSILRNESIQSIVRRTIAELASAWPDKRVAYVSVDSDGVILDTYPLDGVLATLLVKRHALPRQNHGGRWRSEDRILEWSAPTSPGTVLTSDEIGWIHAGIRALVGVPIVRTDRQTDLLCLASTEICRLSEHDQSLMVETAELLSVAQKFAREREERRDAEQALRESEERFRIASESGLDAFIMLRAVTNSSGECGDFRVIYCNRQALDLFRDLNGLRVGATITEILGPKRGLEFVALYRSVLQIGRPREEEFLSELIPPETWFYQQIVPTVDGVAVTARNITARVLAEKQMRRLSTAVEQSANMVCITDTEGIIEYVNPQFCRTTGFSTEESIGRSRRILKSGQTSDGEYGELWSTISAGARWSGKLQNRRKSGSLYWEQLTISPIHDSSGNVSNFVIVSSDVTEELAQQEKMMESDKLAAVGMLAAGVSHEFKNYLGGIIGNATFALEGLDETQDLDIARRTLEDIVRMGERANDVAMSLLTYSKTRPERFAPEDLAAIVTTTTALIAKELCSRSIDLYTHFDDTPLIRLSASKIQQLLLNLLINAEQAIGAKGIISVSVLRWPDGVQLRVADNGLGIPKENVSRIFDPFFSTKGVWGKDNVVGTGMGLAICRNIAREHGGELTVDSIEGLGSTFTLSLPASLFASDPGEVLANRTYAWLSKVLIFSLDTTIFGKLFSRACEVAVSLHICDSHSGVSDGLHQATSLVVCDAEFVGKVELTHVVELCRAAAVPYVMIRCGAMDYQLDHLYAHAAAAFPDLPPLDQILAAVHTPEEFQRPT